MIGVIGGNGFIGRNLSVSLSRDKSPFCYASRSIDPTFLPRINPSEVRRIELADTAAVRSLLENLDQVVFLVNTLLPSRPYDSFPDELSSNLALQTKFFSLCAESGVKQVVFVSSGGTVYGNTCFECIDETVIPEPISAYGVGKLMLEHYLRLLCINSGVGVTVLRVSNPYGPWQPYRSDQGVVAKLMHCYQNRLSFPVYGDGKDVRDFIYISDLISAIKYVLRDPDDGFRLYNLGSGSGTMIIDVVERFSKAAGWSPVLEKRKKRSGDVSVNVLDIKKFCSCFDWQPMVEMDKGLALSLEWLAESGE